METRDFEPGEIIFKAGDDSHEAFSILAGKVEISIDTATGPHSVAHLRGNEIFGEMGLVDDKPRSASARALEKTQLLVITAENFAETILKDEAELVRYISVLNERLRTTDALLEIALRKNAKGAAASEAHSMERALCAEFSTDEEPDEEAGEALPEEDFAIDFKVLFTSAYDPEKWAGEDVKEDIREFPYRIGSRFPGPVPPLMRNDLLVLDNFPGSVPRNHCAFERNADTVFVRDRGSGGGTVVNGVLIGTQADTVTARLNLGDNEIILGGPDSPHYFRAHVEASE